MSGPYRFEGESAKSPLDRTSSPFSAGQPVSFKTNVNRAKTKKWVTAKKNAYDGDDWGGYDEYDEYGVDDEPAQPEPAPAQRYYAGGQQQFEPPQRSFTDPRGPPGKARRNSFETGEEHRAFSASIAPPQQQDHGQQYADPQRQASGVEPQTRRDFTPSAMPPPLQTRMSPVPTDIGASPSNSQFPPRKSSIGQGESPLATSPKPRTGSHSDKPLPFVRPADIYKRMEEERERERASLDSSRPSLDSLTSRPKDDLHSPTSDGGRLLQPLETVAERKSEYLPELPNFDTGLTADGKQQAPNNAGNSSLASPPSDQGFRSVVDQAFTRSDDQRSIPPTPISKDSVSDVSRSNTGSTAGISPIMSRVPSSATSALKHSQGGVDGNTPAIAEEPSETILHVTQPTTGFAHDVAQPTVPKTFADHSRNLSSSSIPRSGLATPTKGDSPARSPIIAPQKDLPEPEVAQYASGSPERSQAMQGGLSGQSPAYAAREADLASALKSNLGAVPALGAAEKRSQDAFLESHVAQSPIEDALPRSRSESPSKGRVQALAGKFGDVSNSRRGSTQSDRSRNSVQSWERSQDNSRAASPTKGSPSKPSSPVKEFRPHLPGQWESYATTATAMTPSDQGERDRGLGFDNDKASNSLADTELTPTTAKRPVEQTAPDSTSDPIAALKSAGAAMAQSFKSTVGLDDADASSDTHEKQGDRSTGRAYGDVYMPRPLQMERTESSLSSIPPTPPAKDTPTNEYPPQLQLKNPDSISPAQQNRPGFFPQLSTDTSADDQESDRLRKEIVASLTPVTTRDPHRSSLQPSSPGANRASSVLPAEYDSYWADGGERSSPRASHDVNRSIPGLNTNTATATQPDETEKPSLLNRFSWEANNPPLTGSIDATSTGAVPEPTKNGPGDSIPSPAIELAAGEERQQWSEGLPGPHFTPGHTLTVTKPDPIADSDLAPRTPTSPPLDHNSLSLSSPTREQTRSPGLHVVNSALNPEAVDLPPRLSADLAAPRRSSQDDLNKSQHELEREITNPAISAAIAVPEPGTHAPAEEPAMASTHESAAKSPTSPTLGKPLQGREIAAINSSAERIATYNKTRDHWAHHDHGLQGWLVSALEANPDIATQPIPVQRTSTGTIRHKHAPSLSILGKFGHHQSQGPEQQSMASQAPVSEGSPTAAPPSSSAPGFDRRVTSRQLEAKGKDLLHTANVLSGKGLTSAKGLFAKGKSRFGNREKVEK